MGRYSHPLNTNRRADLLSPATLLRDLVGPMAIVSCQHRDRIAHFHRGELHTRCGGEPQRAVASCRVVRRLRGVRSNQGGGHDLVPEDLAPVLDPAAQVLPRDYRDAVWRQPRGAG